MSDYGTLAAFVGRAKQGDLEAFQKLYEETWRPLYYFIFKNVGRRADAEDILQDTFVTAYTGIGQLQNDMAVVGWLNRIAYHKIQNYFRKNQKENNHRVHESDEDEGLFDVPDGFLVEEDYIGRESRQELLGIVDSLPEKQREAIYMFYYQELSVEEIAKICGCSENTVCKRLFDARGTMKKRIFAAKGKEDGDRAGKRE